MIDVRNLVSAGTENDSVGWFIASPALMIPADNAEEVTSGSVIQRVITHIINRFKYGTQ
jgi:hypothetical protein